ncbi:hypothetical protein Hanom_Chr08g00686721 [Helianthus anomalus]
MKINWTWMLYLQRYYWMRKKEALIRFLQNGSLEIVGGDGVTNDEAARSAGVPVILDAGGMDAPGVKEVLVKLGGRGSVLFSEGKEPIKQGIIAAEKVLDATVQGIHLLLLMLLLLLKGNPKLNA